VIQLDPQKAVWGDTATYLEVSHLWMQGRGIQGALPSSADLYRPPVYPVFLASIFALAGENYALVVLIQLAITGTTCGLVYLLGRTISPAVGYLAAMVYALTPDTALWAMAILSDTLFTFLLMAALVGLAVACRGTRRLLLALSGLTLGLAALTRPIGLAIIALWAVVWVLKDGSRPEQVRRNLGSGFLFFMVAVLPIALWSYRNLAIHGFFTVSPINTWNLGYYSAPYTLERAEGISLDEARRRALDGGVPTPGEAGRYLGIILRYPMDYLAVHARGTWYLISEVGQPNQALLVGERFRTPGVLTALRRLDLAGAWGNLAAQLQDRRLRWFVILTWPSLGLLAAVYLFALVGGVRLLRRPGEHRWLGALVMGTAAALILLPGPVGNGRFRLPAEPILAFLAASGLAFLGQAIAARPARTGKG
jgi:4-amino-4-deoxy-L-arabinose transferase-like glycosyltransferase